MARANALPPPITGDTYRFTILSKAWGQVCMNSFDFMGESFAVTPGAPMPLLISALITLFEAAYLGTVTAATAVLNYNLQCTSSLAPVSLNTAVNKPGTQAGAALPLEMAAIIKKLSLLKGQHGRGRVFMPSIPVSFTTPLTEANLLNAAGLVGYNNMAASIKGPVTAGTIKYYGAICMRPKAPATVVTLAAQIATIETVPLLSTQRRRREGRGI